MRILIVGGCGYIGSALYKHLASSSYDVVSVDIELFGNPGNIPNWKERYQDLSEKQLSEYQVVVFLAAHSSVAMANNNPRNALLNNILDFYDFLEKTNANQKVIYASSSSVYTGSKDLVVNEDWKQFNVSNIYDLSKYCADALASIEGGRFYGLRFGTVCGYSPNLRVDVMINRMVKTALENSKIFVSNRDINRPILGLTDLSRAFQKLIDMDGPQGVYNLSSFNSTVGEIANQIAKTLDVGIEYLKDTKSYDFSMSSDKFMNSYGFLFNDDPISIAKEIVDNWDRENQGTRV